MKSLRVILIALLMLVVGVFSPAAQESVNDMTVALTRDPGSLDPHGAPHPSSPVLLSYVYDTLVFQNAGGVIEPYLAESWTFDPEGPSIMFNLRDDVVFSNGNPLTADSVIYTFERLQEIGTRSLIYREVATIESFDKLDDYTVRFNLTQPLSTLLSALSYSFAGILDPEATEAAGDEYGFSPVGSGPFAITEWIPETRINMVPNPHYAGHRPTDAPDEISNVETMTVRFTSDQSAMVNALLSGELDAAYISSAAQLDRVKDEEGFTLLDDPSRGLIYLGFNTARAPLDNVQMRRAVGLAVDRQMVVDFVAPGAGQVVNTLIPPSIFGYSADLDSNSGLVYDPAMAQELVGETAYDGRTLKILASTYPIFRDIATLLQAQLAAVGVQSEIEILDFAAVREMAAAGEYDILLTLYNWNDPDVLRLYLSSSAGPTQNRSFYSNPDLDALLEQGRSEFDPTVREEIYLAAQELLLEDLPWLPVYMPVTRVVVNDRIENAHVLHSHLYVDDAVIK